MSWRRKGKTSETISQCLDGTDVEAKRILTDPKKVGLLDAPALEVRAA